MKCLLCQTDTGPLARAGEGLWTLTCPRCGTYRFDSGFADLAKHARARHRTDLVRWFVRLSAAVQNCDDVLTIRRDNYVALVEEWE